jgi:hypothetical protein
VEAQRVEHPHFGGGRLLRTYANGQEWEVSFDSGRRYRLPAHEFKNGAVAPQLAAEPNASGLEDASVTVTAAAHPVSELGPSRQFRARQAIEVLRMGTVPVQEIEAFTIGLLGQTKTLEQSLGSARERGGVAQAVIGDYGYGKSHFIEIVTQRALKANFVVARTSLDLKEVPPNKPYEIYRALMAAVQYPDTYERGVGPLLRKTLERPDVMIEIAHMSRKFPACPLTRTLHTLDDPRNIYVQTGVIRWLGAQIKSNALISAAFKRTTGSTSPRLYTNGENGRQYSYLLTAFSTLAHLLGYSGLAVLVDESEHYSLLRANQRQRADTFWQAMIHAASGTHSLIDPNVIPGDPRAPEYPVSFARKPHLFFLFALTENEAGMPVREWLDTRQVVQLDERFNENDLQRFFKHLLVAHGWAYDYTPDQERYEGVFHDVPKLLLRGLRQHRFNLRALIQIAVTVCDLLYLYPIDPPTQVLSDLKRAL